MLEVILFPAILGLLPGAITRAKDPLLWRTVLVVVIPIVVVGCASTVPPATVRISVEDAQAEFGTLAVAAVERVPQVSLGRPLTSRGKAVARGALKGALGPVLIGSDIDVQAGIYGIFLAPLTTIVGTIYGALAARSPEQVEQAVLILERTGQVAEVQYHLRDLVMTHLNREQLRDVIAAGETNTAKPPADTVVEVWIADIALVGDGINPRLTIRLSGSMRLLRAGVEVGYVWMSSQGQAHTLLKWAADDARLFRAQIAQESEKLAKDVVSTLLSRPIPRIHYEVGP